jgi:hypothetical protein
MHLILKKQSVAILKRMNAFKRKSPEMSTRGKYPIFDFKIENYKCNIILFLCEFIRCQESDDLR